MILWEEELFLSLFFSNAASLGPKLAILTISQLKKLTDLGEWSTPQMTQPARVQLVTSTQVFWVEAIFFKNLMPPKSGSVPLVPRPAPSLQ